MNITYNAGSDTAIVSGASASVAAYLDSLPEPYGINTAWAVPTGEGAYEVSKVALAEVKILAGIDERPEPSAPSGPLFYG